MIKLNLQFYGEKVYVDATDKNGKKVEGAYAIDGKTYKADGTRIDAGTSVVTAGGTFTYNGDGTSSKISNKTSNNGGSKTPANDNGAFVGGAGGGQTPANTTQEVDYNTEMQKALSEGRYNDVLNLNSMRNGKIAASNGALDKYANDTADLVREAQTALANQRAREEQESQQEEYFNLSNELANAIKKQQKNQLEQAYRNVINQIGSAEKDTVKNAKASSDKASVQNQLANQRLARVFANTGLSNSGTNAQAQINSAGQLQNALGTIDAQKNSALDDYLTQRNTAYTNLLGDINAAEAGVDATMLQNQLGYVQNLQEAARNLQYQKDLINYQNQINNGNLVGWTSPYGTTYQLDPSTAAQLDLNRYNSSLKNAGGGSTGTDLDALYLAYLKSNGYSTDSMTEEQFAEFLSGKRDFTDDGINEEKINDLYADAEKKNGIVGLAENQLNNSSQWANYLKENPSKIPTSALNLASTLVVPSGTPAALGTAMISNLMKKKK